MSKVEITTLGIGKARVLVDGHDLSNAITHYTVEHSGGDIGPKVTLTLRRIEDKRLCMEHADVVLDDATRDFLADAGWVNLRDEEAAAAIAGMIDVLTAEGETGGQEAGA